MGPVADPATERLQEADMSNTPVDEYNVVEAALAPYLHAARTGDGSGMRSIWMDDARIIGSLDGQAVHLDPDAFADLIDNVGGSPTVKAKIVRIEVQGNAAAARIEFEDWGGVRYTDFFNLYRRDGIWKVASKVYDSHDRN